MVWNCWRGRGLECQSEGFEAYGNDQYSSCVRFPTGWECGPHPTLKSSKVLTISRKIKSENKEERRAGVGEGYVWYQKNMVVWTTVLRVETQKVIHSLCCTNKCEKVSFLLYFLDDKCYIFIRQYFCAWWQLAPFGPMDPFWDLPPLHGS